MSINDKLKEKCCGCAACMNRCPKDAITMVEDEKGFRYPKIDQTKCIECGLCEKSCPVLQNKRSENEPKAYACINKVEEFIRRNFWFIGKRNTIKKRRCIWSCF